ncbi:MAG: AI-2E family transporter [Bacteroidetes bacterium]|nr:AI-2E family transporter [Bacteroidota bacterium]
MDISAKTSSLIKFTVVLVSLSIIIAILYIGQNIFIPLVLALLFAIILSPVASFLNLKLRFTHGLAAIVSVILFFAVITVVVLLISWQISDMTNDWIQIKKNLLIHYESAQHWVKNKYNLSYNKQDNYMQQVAQKSMNGDSQFMGNTLSSFTDTALSIVLIPIYCFLILLYRNLFITFLYQMVRYKNEDILVEVLSKIKSVIKSYIVGIFIEMGIVGILTTSGFLILGIHYAILLGAITALLNLIPYIGILVAGSIAIFATLGNSTDVYLILGIIIVNIVVQFIDNNIIVPKIVGNKVSINSLVTMIGVIIGGSLWGIPGMILSIPIMAIIKIIFDNIESLKPWGALLGNIIPANSKKSILTKLKIIK